MTNSHISEYVHKMKYPSRIQQVIQRTGLSDSKNLLWSWYEPRNFGDWIGPYLFLKMTGKDPLHCKPKRGKASLARTVSTAGSILRHIEVDDRVTVWGSGIISKSDTFSRPKNVLAVRGPRTRERLKQLGFPNSDVFGDPGLLMPYFYTPTAKINNKVGIIPHYVDYENIKSHLSATPGIKVVDVTQHIEKVIDEITSCEFLLSSSLHGIIISHAYKRPCAWISAKEKITGDNVKYIDYLESVGLHDIFDPVDIKKYDVGYLTELSQSFPTPNTEGLAERLLAACPFYR